MKKFILSVLVFAFVCVWLGVLVFGNHTPMFNGFVLVMGSLCCICVAMAVSE